MLYVGRFENGCPTNGIRLEGPPPPVGGRLGAAAMACLLGDVDERAVDAAAARAAGEGLLLSAVRLRSSAVRAESNGEWRSTSARVSCSHDS